jgi:hypothetical protein
MKTLILVSALAMAAAASAQAAPDFDPSVCSKNVTVQYAGIHDASNGVLKHTHDGALTLHFELENEELLKLYKVCLYRGNDDAVSVPGVWLYDLEFRPHGAQDEQVMTITSQAWIEGKTVSGILNFPQELVRMTPSHTPMLVNPNGSRELIVTQPMPQPDIGVIPDYSESAGIAANVSITTN